MTPSTSTRSGLSAPTYKRLGVRPLINCMGTYTIVSGSRVLDAVAEAMVAAGDAYVDMEELIAAVGKRLAELSGAEWGYVATGCAAALAEVAAACIAGGDPEGMARLPDTQGMPNEVIMQRGHRNSYDRAIRLAGARIVEVETIGELLTAIGPRTAMLAVTGDQAHLGRIPVEEMIAVGRRCGVPVLVDAAAERPDVPNVYLAMGADAVAYSGGKCLRGPQASGLVLGRKRLLQAACLNGAPYHSLGRPMKAGKEEIMGLLAAFEAWVLGRNHDDEWRDWEGYLETIRTAVADLPTMSAEMRQPGVANVAPTLYLAWDPGTLGHTPAGVRRALWDGEPRVGVREVDGGLLIMPYMMEAGEDAIVARRLREVLCAAPEPAPAAEPDEPMAAVAGEWRVSLRFVHGVAEHVLHLLQEDGRLAGTYVTPYARVPVEGEVHGRRLRFRVTLGYESNQVAYAFEGRADADVLAGTVSLGEYGRAEWSARREGAKDGVQGAAAGQTDLLL